MIDVKSLTESASVKVEASVLSDRVRWPSGAARDEDFGGITGRFQQFYTLRFVLRKKHPFGPWLRLADLRRNLLIDSCSNFDCTPLPRLRAHGIGAVGNT